MIIAAVVLNWNQSALTLDCVATLRKSERLCDRIIVIDNGSRPEQLAILADVRTATDVTYLPLATNRGFAGGMNAGIREAARLGADYVWLVNNDAFPEPNCLARLLAVMEADTSLACVTPRLLGTDGVEQPAGGRYDIATGENTFADNAMLAQPVGTDGFWAVATAPLFRTIALTKSKGFDERFFAYWEEVDLCLRLARCGYRFQAVPDVTVLHLGRASSGESNFAHYLYVRNQFWLLRKHLSGQAATMLRLARRHLDNAGCYEAHGQNLKAQAVLEAVYAGLRREQGRPRRYGTMPKTCAFLARHPWQIIRALDLLQRFIGPRTAKGVSA